MFCCWVVMETLYLTISECANYNLPVEMQMLVSGFQERKVQLRGRRKDSGKTPRFVLTQYSAQQSLSKQTFSNYSTVQIYAF